MEIVSLVVGVISLAVGVGLIVAVFAISSNTRKTVEELASIRTMLFNQIKQQNRPRTPVDNQTTMPDGL